METKKSNKKIVIGLVAVIAIIVVLCAVYFMNKPQASAGAKAVEIQVVDDNGEETDYNVNTDAEYLADVFDEVDGLTVEGDQSDYGLYINTVNGLTADYDADGAYWAIYVNGEYGQYGADSQPVADGDVFKLAYEVYAQ